VCKERHYIAYISMFGLLIMGYVAMLKWAAVCLLGLSYLILGCKANIRVDGWQYRIKMLTLNATKSILRSNFPIFIQDRESPPKTRFLLLRPSRRQGLG